MPRYTGSTSTNLFPGALPWPFHPCIGIDDEGRIIPSAILIDTDTGECLVAVYKKYPRTHPHGHDSYEPVLESGWTGVYKAIRMFFQPPIVLEAMPREKKLAGLTRLRYVEGIGIETAKP